MKLSPFGVQAGLRYLCKSLSNLHSGISLDEKAEQLSGMVRRGIGRFQFFCECPSPDDKGIFLRGEAAYEVLYKQLAIDKERGAPVSLEGLEQLQLFVWLAGANQAAVCELLKACAADMSKAGKKQKKGKGAATSSSAAGAATSSSAAVDSGKNKRSQCSTAS